MSTDYDVIAVGGGLGGAALAKVLAQNGRRVLVVERESQFKDRIRGEWIAPWGVTEAQRLGIYDTLLKRCAREAPYFDTIGMGPPRDLRATTPQRLPALTLYHPAMQEAVLDLARSAGAEVWRGASVREVRPGASPAVSTERDGQVQRPQRATGRLRGRAQLDGSDVGRRHHSSRHAQAARCRRAVRESRRRRGYQRLDAQPFSWACCLSIPAGRWTGSRLSDVRD